MNLQSPMLRRVAVLVMTAGWLLSVSSGQRGAAQNTSPQATGTIRRYYIAADEVDWNYAPAELDPMTGKPYDERARIFVENGPTQIGRVYKKAIYREYTDASFTRYRVGKLSVPSTIMSYSLKSSSAFALVTCVS